MKRALVFALLAVVAATAAIGRGTVSAAIFREYIGALGNNVTLSDVPISISVDEVHFILAFAIDYDSDSSNFTNGKFSAFWDTNTITPSAISDLKASYSNVKFMLSLGGDTAGDEPVRFQPTNVDSWVYNAVSSLTSLIQQYGLDGIDVDYERFSNADFTTAIGELITQLKHNGVISIASIAPYNDSEVISQYTALWSSYSSVIDYVNYQFYGYDPDTSADQFLSLYNDAVSTFSGGRVLASFSTESDTGGPAPSTVLSACQTLKDSGRLPGIFIWCADSSYNNSSFEYETQAQALLAS